MARPKDPELQHTLYSGYKKQHTLKYEIALSASSLLPVWVSGPFSCPDADISIFRNSLRNVMVENGCVGLADGTYQGELNLLAVPPRPYRNLTLQ